MTQNIIISMTIVQTFIRYVQVCRQVTRAKSKSGAVVKHQRMFVVLETTSNTKRLFKSGAVPLYCSLVTFLVCIVKIS